MEFKTTNLYLAAYLFAVHRLFYTISREHNGHNDLGRLAFKFDDPNIEAKAAQFISEPMGISGQVFERAVRKLKCALYVAREKAGQGGRREMRP